MLCYTAKAQRSSSRPESSHIEWTDESSAIYAHAVRNDLSDLTLCEWWVSSSGPVLGAGTAGPGAKDRPPIATVAPPADGSYLAGGPGCGLNRTTCVMHLHGTTYDITIIGDESLGDELPNEIGTISLRKPASIVFSPTAGLCLSESGGSHRPGTYTWTRSGDRLSFERTGGGPCAGPGFTDPWTRAPEGVFALESGQDIGLMDTGGTFVAKLTNLLPTRPNVWPDWSPDGSRIVFAGAGEEGFDLYVMNADGGGLVQITDVPGDEYTPAWSPDGTQIAFGFDDGGDPTWRSGIAVVSPDGAGLRELVTRDNERVEMPAWSPDGSRIAFTIFTTHVSPEPHVMDVDGTGLVRLRDEPGVVLSWTPDGRRILISGDGSFLSVRPDGSDERVFVEDLPGGGRLVIDWSPDGRWIVMSSPYGFGLPVYLMRADGTEVFLIGSGSEPSWRPEPP